MTRFAHLVILIVLLPRVSFAVQTFEPGQTLALKEDLILAGDETLENQGEPNRRCTHVGIGHRSRTPGEWQGSLRIRNRPPAP